MKSFSYKLIGKNQINLQKTDFINDSDYYILKQDIQEKKRLLHFALMKFIKTQYNKKFDMLINNSKSKDFFSRFNNLNLLPYLKRQLYKNHIDKNSGFRVNSKENKIPDNKSYFSQTKNINEYISKRASYKSQQKVNKSNENIDKNRNKKVQNNRIKSSFESESIKYI